MIRPNRTHLAAVELAVRSRYHAHRVAVFGLEQVIAQTAAPPRRGVGRMLLGLEGLVEALA